MTDNILRIDPREPGASVKMMKTPDLWPLGNALAMKRPRPADIPPVTKDDVFCMDEHSELGMMFMSPGVERWSVVRVNLHDWRMKSILWKAEIPEGVTVYSYEDAEGVFDAGWRVD